MNKILLPEEDFEEWAKRAALKGQFCKIAEQTLIQVLGETGTAATIHYLGTESFQDPKIFKERTRIIFGEGADLILEYVLRNLMSSQQP